MSLKKYWYFMSLGVAGATDFLEEKEKKTHTFCVPF